MPRHAKHNTTAPFYTAVERQTLKMGSEEARLSKDSIRNYDACGLCLQAADQPLVTTEGVIYCKACIYENIYAQKEDAKKKTALWEAQEAKKKAQEKEKAAQEQKAKEEKFEKRESSVLLNAVEVFKRKSDASEDGSKKAKVTSAGEAPQKLPYWVPSETPTTAATEIAPPSKEVLCPTTRKPLKLKHLYSVKYTPLKLSEKESASGSKIGKHMCAICFETLSNVVRAAVIASTGTVVCVSCTDKFVRKDLKDPITGSTIKEKEIIALQSGGTGFAAHDSTLVVKKLGTTVHL